MTGFAALLLTAAVAAAVARWLSLPSIPVLLLGGWGLSLAGPSLSEDVLANSLELGLAFLVFASGAELDPRRLQRHVRTALGAAVAQMAVTGALVFGLGLLLGLSAETALYLAVAFSASSTLVATRQLRRLAQTQEPFARFATRMLLAQDFTVILLITALASMGGGALASFAALAKLVLLIVPVLALQKWVMPWFTRGRRLAEETLLLFLLAALFLFLAAAAFLDLPLIAGAFFAGTVFSRFPLNGVVRGQLASLSDFFTAMFFTALAQVAAQPGPALIAKGVAFAALLLLARPVLVAFMARRSGLESRASWESGLLLSQVSEYALIVGLTGLHLGVLGIEELALIGIVTALTMTVTPFVANDATTTRLLHWARKRRPPETGEEWEDHVLMLGYGAGGKWVLKPLVDQGVPVLVVDDDPVVAAHVRESGVECLCGDGGDPAVLEAAGAGRAKAVLVSTRRVLDAVKVLRKISGTPVVVRVFEKAEADLVERHGGIPVLNSKAGAEAFLEWFRKADFDRAPEVPEPLERPKGSRGGEGSPGKGVADGDRSADGGKPGREG